MTLRRWATIASSSILATVMTSCAAAGPTSTTSRAANAQEPALVGTVWQLVSYRTAASGPDLRATADATLSLDGRGSISAHACNFQSGKVVITSHTLATTAISETLIGCGPTGALDDAVTATLAGTTTWQIRHGALVLTNNDGHRLTYRVRASIYPDATAATVLKGSTPGGGRFRLAVRSRTAGGADFLEYEGQPWPGAPWSTAGVAAPGPKDCLAESVLPVADDSHDVYVIAWLTPSVATAVARATATSAAVTLTAHPAPGTDLRIAAAWVPGFKPGASAVSFFSSTGKLISAYPTGPC